ncbi:MAG: serine hydrolase [Lysobacterales bacterium]|jgi:CubicO group peptidase (beta-lactamase class C family)
MKTLRLFLAALLLAPALAAQAAPYIDPKDDPEHFASADNILFWKPDQQVAGYRNMEKITNARLIPASDNPLILQERHADLDSLVIDDATGMTVDDYIDEQSVAGLLVIKDGAIVYERYALGNNRNSRWISYSVAKSVTSMLVGAAIRDGYIRSVDDKVTDYLPLLKGSAYDQATIRDALHMASGVAWDETYDDPESDINQASWKTLDLFDYLRDKPRAGPPGETFNYSTAEANLIGDVLRAAIGNNLSTYLEQKIWQPFGMESDAYWNLTEAGGGEFGGCCLNATLRDYGRLGLFALNNGRLADGTPVLPTNWMADSTTPSKANEGYGYLWWLNKNGAYEASGIFGQGIYVFPEKNLVIALQSARPDASKEEDWKLESELFRSIAGALDGGSESVANATD